MTEQLLNAVSQVIELKPDKRYMLVFTGDVYAGEALDKIRHFLYESGIGLILPEGVDLQVIEAPLHREGEACTANN